MQVRIARPLVALLLLSIATPQVARAVQIDVLSESLGVDTVARVLNPIDPARIPDAIDDPPAVYGSAPTQSASISLTDTHFTDPVTQAPAVRFGQAEGVAVNVGVDLPTQYVFNASAVIGGNGDPYFDESAEAAAFGDVLFQISEAGIGAGTEAFLEIGFDEASFSPDIGIATVSVVVTNLTLGTVLFDSSVDAFPDNLQVSGARVGDDLKLEWYLDVAGDIPDDTASGEVGVAGWLQVVALGEPVSVPEPSLGALLALAASALVRLRGSARA